MHPHLRGNALRAAAGARVGVRSESVDCELLAVALLAGLALLLLRVDCRTDFGVVAVGGRCFGLLGDRRRRVAVEPLSLLWLWSVAAGKQIDGRSVSSVTHM